MAMPTTAMIGISRFHAIVSARPLHGNGPPVIHDDTYRSPSYEPWGNGRHQLNGKRAREPGDTSAGPSTTKKAAKKASEDEAGAQREPTTQYRDRDGLLAALRERFRAGPNVDFHGTYEMQDSGITHKERIQTVAHEIWKTTGYRFTVKDHPQYTNGHKTRFWCSQDEAHRSKSSRAARKAQGSCYKPRVTSAGEAMAKERFACRSRLLISSRDTHQPGTRVITIRMHHHVSHEPYIDASMSQETIQHIWRTFSYSHQQTPQEQQHHQQQQPHQQHQHQHHQHHAQPAQTSTSNINHNNKTENDVNMDQVPLSMHMDEEEEEEEESSVDADGGSRMDTGYHRPSTDDTLRHTTFAPTNHIPQPPPQPLQQPHTHTQPQALPSHPQPQALPPRPHPQSQALPPLPQPRPQHQPQPLSQPQSHPQPQTQPQPILHPPSEEFHSKMLAHIKNLREFCEGLEYQLQFNDYRMLDVLEREGGSFLGLVEDCLRKEGRLVSVDHPSISQQTQPQQQPQPRPQHHHQAPSASSHSLHSIRLDMNGRHAVQGRQSYDGNPGINPRALNY